MRADMIAWLSARLHEAECQWVDQRFLCRKYVGISKVNLAAMATERASAIESDIAILKAIIAELEKGEK